MLVLTRKKGEQVFIDNGKIKIKVLYRRGNSIALGISAPAHTDVDREEIFLRKRADIQKEGRVDASTL